MSLSINIIILMIVFKNVPTDKNILYFTQSWLRRRMI